MDVYPAIINVSNTKGGNVNAIKKWVEKGHGYWLRSYHHRPGS